MDLEGSLSVFDPLSVFQLMSLAECSGELNIDVGHNSARVYFDRGAITYAEISNRSVKLGEYLVGQELITRDDLESILDDNPQGKRMGDLLVERGAIEEKSIRKALEEQIKEVIYEVVKWRRGWFSFVRGQEPRTREISIDIPLDHLILEGLKRMDEEGS